MLKDKFWTGMQQSLKGVSGYLHVFDQITSYEDLLVAMRRIELEHIVKTNHSKQAVKAEDKEKEELKATIQRMSNEIVEIKSAQSLPRENTFNTNFQRGSYKGNSKKKFHNKKRLVKSDQNRQLKLMNLMMRNLYAIDAVRKAIFSLNAV